VTDALTGKPAIDAEVTVVVVDEAILALLPYPLPVRFQLVWQRTVACAAAYVCVMMDELSRHGTLDAPRLLHVLLFSQSTSRNVCCTAEWHSIQCANHQFMPYLDSLVCSPADIGVSPGCACWAGGLPLCVLLHQGDQRVPQQQK
jgi:hypothetical protein